MAKRWLTQRSITLESEVVNIKVANSNSFTINGSPALPSSPQLPNVACVPSLNAGSITTFHPPNPIYSASMVGNSKSLYIKSFIVDTNTGSPTQIAYNQTSILPVEYRPGDNITVIAKGLDNNLPTTLQVIVTTLGVVFIAKLDFSVLTQPFGLSDSICVTFNV